jgi:hypothetical protein
MSRAGITDDPTPEQWRMWGLHQQALDLAIAGKRGQTFFRDLIAALDAMPVKRLASSVFVGERGECCAMGAVALHRRLAPAEIAALAYDDSGDEPMDRGAVAEALDIAPSLATDVAYENDEGAWSETDEQRWQRMRALAVHRLHGDGP